MTDFVTNARKFLESLERYDLSMLLGPCEATIEKITIPHQVDFDRTVNVEEDCVVVRAPRPIDEALETIGPQDRKRLAQAVTSVAPDTPSPDDIRVEKLPGPPAEGSAALLAELFIHRAMMIDVATGGDRIQDVDDYYRAREARIRRTLPDDVEYRNPHGDLWDWYRHWSGSPGGYKERRQYIRQMFAPVIAAVAARSSLPPSRREPTGWERVDRALAKARGQLELASAEEDFQAIGLICREVIISLAQGVYDPEIHESPDGVVPSPTDANRMLDAYITQAFPGASNKEVRAHARASLALALNLQHRRTATRQLATLCVEATGSTAAVISIIARPES